MQVRLPEEVSGMVQPPGDSQQEDEAVVAAVTAKEQEQGMEQDEEEGGSEDYGDSDFDAYSDDDFEDGDEDQEQQPQASASGQGQQEAEERARREADEQAEQLVQQAEKDEKERLRAQELARKEADAQELVRKEADALELARKETDALELARQAQVKMQAAERVKQAAATNFKAEAEERARNKEEQQRDIRRKHAAEQASALAENEAKIEQRMAAEVQSTKEAAEVVHRLAEANAKAAVAVKREEDLILSEEQSRRDVEKLAQLEAEKRARKVYRPIHTDYPEDLGGVPGGLGKWAIDGGLHIQRAAIAGPRQELVTRGRRQYQQKHGCKASESRQETRKSWGKWDGKQWQSER